MYSEIAPHTSQSGAIKKSPDKNAGEDIKNGEPSSTTGRNVNWCSHCGEQYGDYLRNWK